MGAGGAAPRHNIRCTVAVRSSAHPESTRTLRKATQSEKKFFFLASEKAISTVHIQKRKEMKDGGGKQMWDYRARVSKRAFARAE